MPNRSVGLGHVLPDRAVAYYEGWLTSNKRTHSEAAISEFIAAHPFMFGRSANTAANGYRSRLRQTQAVDTPAGFATYIEIRYTRWRDARRKARGPL